MALFNMSKDRKESGKNLFWKSFTDIFWVGLIILIICWIEPDLRNTGFLFMCILFSLCFVTRVVEKQRIIL